MHADERAYVIIEHAGIANAQLVHAADEDWDTEYLALKIGIKVVDSLDEAIAHINRYSTGHSEAIITSSYENAQKFLDQVDSAAVYVNASVSPMAACSDSARNLASPHRRCMRAVRWGCAR